MQSLERNEPRWRSDRIGIFGALSKNGIFRSLYLRHIHGFDHFKDRRASPGMSTPRCARKNRRFAAVSFSTKKPRRSAQNGRRGRRVRGERSDGDRVNHGQVCHLYDVGASPACSWASRATSHVAVAPYSVNAVNERVKYIDLGLQDAADWLGEGPTPRGDLAEPAPRRRGAKKESAHSPRAAHHTFLVTTATRRPRVPRRQKAASALVG